MVPIERVGNERRQVALAPFPGNLLTQDQAKT